MEGGILNSLWGDNAISFSQKGLVKDILNVGISQQKEYSWYENECMNCVWRVWCCV